MAIFLYLLAVLFFALGVAFGSEWVWPVLTGVSRGSSTVVDVFFFAGVLGLLALLSLVSLVGGAVVQQLQALRRQFAKLAGGQAAGRGRAPDPAPRPPAADPDV